MRIVCVHTLFGIFVTNSSSHDRHGQPEELTVHLVNGIRRIDILDLKDLTALKGIRRDNTP